MKVGPYTYIYICIYIYTYIYIHTYVYTINKYGADDRRQNSDERDVKKDLLQCQKRPTTVSKETYYS